MRPHAEVPVPWLRGLVDILRDGIQPAAGMEQSVLADQTLQDQGADTQRARLGQREHPVLPRGQSSQRGIHRRRHPVTMAESAGAGHAR